jgi:hypothetical protein
MEFVPVTSITTVGSNLAVGVENNIDTFFYSIPYDPVFSSRKEKEKFRLIASLNRSSP